MVLHSSGVLHIQGSILAYGALGAHHFRMLWAAEKDLWFMQRRMCSRTFQCGKEGNDDYVWYDNRIWNNNRLLRCAWLRVYFLLYTMCGSVIIV